jgi:hypothetical protein
MEEERRSVIAYIYLPLKKIGGKGVTGLDSTENALSAKKTGKNRIPTNSGGNSCNQIFPELFLHKLVFNHLDLM